MSRQTLYEFVVRKLDCYQGAGGKLDVADPPLLGDASGFYHRQCSDLGRPCFRERLFRCCCQPLEHEFLPMGLTQATVKVALTFKDPFQVF